MFNTKINTVITKPSYNEKLCLVLLARWSYCYNRVWLYFWQQKKTNHNKQNENGAKKIKFKAKHALLNHLTRIVLCLTEVPPLIFKQHANIQSVSQIYTNKVKWNIFVPFWSLLRRTHLLRHLRGWWKLAPCSLKLNLHKQI